MICLDDHHNYELAGFEGVAGRQTLKFIKKQKLTRDTQDHRLETIHDGTTNEEVLKVLIHRTQSMNNKLPSRESSLAITKMQEALMWFEARTKDRKERGVEGTHQK